MPTYNGWTVVTMPNLTTDSGTPLVPSGMEFQTLAKVAVADSEFNFNQQVYDQNSNVLEGSVAYNAVKRADGQTFAAFLISCKGPACVFQFSTGMCTLFPVELTTDGTTPRYFRLKPGSMPHWSVKKGQVYSFTFEVREAK